MTKDFQKYVNMLQKSIWGVGEWIFEYMSAGKGDLETECAFTASPQENGILLCLAPLRSLMCTEWSKPTSFPLWSPHILLCWFGFFLALGEHKQTQSYSDRPFCIGAGQIPSALCLLAQASLLLCQSSDHKVPHQVPPVPVTRWFRTVDKLKNWPYMN